MLGRDKGPQPQVHTGPSDISEFAHVRVRRTTGEAGASEDTEESPQVIALRKGAKAPWPTKHA